MLSPLEIAFIAAVAVIIILVAVALWYSVKQRVEMPLPNETDLGSYMIALPTGVDEGRLTTARRSVESWFETAIANATEKLKSEIIGARDEVLKYHLYGWKGDQKCILYSDADLTDEKQSFPLDRDTRLLKTPQEFIDKGEQGGFRYWFLKMYNPETRMTPPERKVHAVTGDVVKHIRMAALNTEKETQLRDEIDFYQSSLKAAQKKLREATSKQVISDTAAAATTFTGEKPKPKAPWHFRMEEWFYSGWRIVWSAGAGALLYFVAQHFKLPVDPFIPLGVAALAVFLVYPYVSKWLK